MPEIDIKSNYPALNNLAGEFLTAALAPKFTSTPEGRIQTDIAAACSLSGLMILQETVPDLSEVEPGIVILSDVHGKQNKTFEFMAGVAFSNGLDPHDGLEDSTARHSPLFECAEMTQRLAPGFYDLCTDWDRPFYKYIAALAGMKLVLAGNSTGLLNPNAGKGLAAYFVVAGSKTAPFPEALWPALDQ